MIAKLDRLSRNVAFIASMESGVEFVACDQPQANKFTVHIFAALAEQERDIISERTRCALQVLKAHGKQLGTPANLIPAAHTHSLASRQQNARTHEGNRQATALILARRAQGYGYNQIAQELESLGFRTRRGCFTHKQVQRLAQRAAEQVASCEMTSRTVFVAYSAYFRQSIHRAIVYSLLLVDVYSCGTLLDSLACLAA